MMAWLFLFSIAPLVAIGGSTWAQESDEVFLHATYLGAPTGWCPADQGVPVVVTMDGPDIVESPESWPVTVRENRGSQKTRVTTEEWTSSLRRHRNVDDAEVIGRFSAEFRACQDPWNRPLATGRWRLSADDGSELDGGSIEDNWRAFSDLPFFRRFKSGSKSHVAKFGERQMFTASYPKITSSQSFAAETDKE